MKIISLRQAHLQEEILSFPLNLEKSLLFKDNLSLLNKLIMIYIFLKVSKDHANVLNKFSKFNILF